MPNLLPVVCFLHVSVRHFIGISCKCQLLHKKECKIREALHETLVKNAQFIQEFLVKKVEKEKNSR